MISTKWQFSRILSYSVVASLLFVLLDIISWCNGLVNDRINGKWTGTIEPKHEKDESI